jgi:hypothetical protein
MPAGKAAVTAGSVVTAIPGITAAVMPAEAMVAAVMEVVVTAAEVVVAIEARPRVVRFDPSATLDSFQCDPPISLELLQNAAFPAASGCIRRAHSISKGSTFSMGLLL